MMSIARVRISYDDYKDIDAKQLINAIRKLGLEPKTVIVYGKDKDNTVMLILKL